MVELYTHSLICLHDVMLNLLSKRKFALFLMDEYVYGIISFLLQFILNPRVYLLQLIQVDLFY